MWWVVGWMIGSVDVGRVSVGWRSHKGKAIYLFFVG